MEIMTTTSLAFSRPTGQVNLIAEFDTLINNPLQCNKRQERQNQSSVLLFSSSSAEKFNRLYEIMSSYASKSSKTNYRFKI